MYAPYPLIGIGGQRTVVGVERMGGYEDFSAGKAAHEGGVVKVARLVAQLDEIAYFQLVERRFFAERPRALVFRQETEKIFDARPGGGSVVGRLIKPARDGGKVHDPAARVQALGSIIGTVSAQFIEIVISGIASERPFFCIGRRGGPIIDKSCHTFSI